MAGIAFSRSLPICAAIARQLKNHMLFFCRERAIRLQRRSPEKEFAALHSFCTAQYYSFVILVRWCARQNPCISASGTCRHYCKRLWRPRRARINARRFLGRATWHNGAEQRVMLSTGKRRLGLQSQIMIMAPGLGNSFHGLQATLPLTCGTSMKCGLSPSSRDADGRAAASPSS